jgi:hypothetical protein
VIFNRGDLVSLKEHAMEKRLRSGVCVRSELEALTIVALKETGVGMLAKLRTRDGSSIGWERTDRLLLVRRE